MLLILLLSCLMIEMELGNILQFTKLKKLRETSEQAIFLSSFEIFMLYCSVLVLCKMSSLLKSFQKLHSVRMKEHLGAKKINKMKINRAK